MSLATHVIIDGNAVRISERTGKIKNGDRAGQDFKVVTATVFGQHCQAEVTIPDGLTAPEVGKRVVMQCEVSTYRDDDQLRLVAYVA